MGETLRQGGEAGGWGPVPVLLCSCGLQPVLATSGVCGHIGIMAPFCVVGPRIQPGTPWTWPWASYDLWETWV